MKTVTVIAVLMLVLAGCATPQGRYLQAKHPINNTVMVQMDCNTPEFCQINRSSAVKSSGANNFYCGNMSASSILPYSLDVKDKVMDITLTYELATAEMCDALVTYVNKSEERALVVTPCHHK